MKIKFYGNAIKYFRFKLSTVFNIIDPIIALMDEKLLNPIAFKKGK